MTGGGWDVCEWRVGNKSPACVTFSLQPCDLEQVPQPAQPVSLSVTDR